MITCQNDLTVAQKDEINGKISYLNALTELDRLPGTTLDTWKIELRCEDDEIESLLKDR